MSLSHSETPDENKSKRAELIRFRPSSVCFPASALGSVSTGALSSARADCIIAII